MAQPSKVKETEQQDKIAAQVSKTEEFYNENKKTIWSAVIAVVVVGLGILGYQKWIYQPACAEAQEQAYPAEAAFRDGNYAVALDGDGNNLGFADLCSQYGAKCGKAVYFYAGVSALQEGRFEEALKYLKKYNGKETILAARAIACTGDAYCGLEDYENAAKYFQKAAAKADNVFAAQYLLKAGIVLEELGQNEKALKCYETIKDQYPQSIEGYDIDKYINRIK